MESQMSQLVQQFLRAKELELTSPKSITSLRYSMQVIIEAVDTVCPTVPPEQLTALQLRALVGHLVAA